MSAAANISRNTLYQLCVLTFVLLLASCGKSRLGEAPPAQTLTREANGYYCLMTVLNHRGPKGQIILTDRKQALWFTSVRDMIYFSRLPVEPKNIAAMYVNDMTNADWDAPGVENWIDARKAWYVLGSGLTGGMGASETVPFATKSKAELFAGSQGGTVHTFESIPQAYILDSSL